MMTGVHPHNNPCNPPRHLVRYSRFTVISLPRDSTHSTDDFRAVFIRAPAVLAAGPGVEVLAEYALTPEERAKHGRDKVIVGVRKGVLMATAFHPELTTDIRWWVGGCGLTRREGRSGAGREGVKQGGREEGGGGGGGIGVGGYGGIAWVVSVGL